MKHDCHFNHRVSANASYLRGIVGLRADRRRAHNAAPQPRQHAVRVRRLRAREERAIDHRRGLFNNGGRGWRPRVVRHEAKTQSDVNDERDRAARISTKSKTIQYGLPLDLKHRHECFT